MEERERETVENRDTPKVTHCSMRLLNATTCKTRYQKSQRVVLDIKLI